MKTRLYLKFLFGLLLLTATSCNRSDGTTVVEGQVVDKYTGKGVPDAIVGVYSTSTSSMGGFNHKELEKQADSKGNFSFSFDSEDSRDYALIASKGRNYAANYADPLILKEDRNNKKLKVKMEPLAWVRVKLVNTPPKDMVSRLHIQGFTDMIDGNVSVTLINFQRDTTFIRMVGGNTNWIFLFSTRDTDGNTIQTNPSAYFPALDTTDLIINY